MGSPGRRHGERRPRRAPSGGRAAEESAQTAVDQVGLLRWKADGVDVRQTEARQYLERFWANGPLRQHRVVRCAIQRLSVGIVERRWRLGAAGGRGLLQNVRVGG